MNTKRPVVATRDHRVQYVRRYMNPALRIIWEDIISPIFDAIQILTTPAETLPERRIWWYLTGPLSFFPIHAAGPHRGPDVSRLVVSSYVTTLQSLYATSTQLPRKRPDNHLKLLAIGQPETPGQGDLPSAEVEVKEVVRAVLRAGGSEEATTYLIGSDATVGRVSSSLESCTWVHFACHGLQHPTDGIKSAFALHDGLLQLDAIASKRITNGQFAFLSVCQAAAGLKEMQGEAMHLAAGLQFVGFGSVIATLWSICDEDAPVIAQRVYQHLFRDGVARADASDAATALNHAVLALREDRKIG
ncbi:hypothetical protein HWV62_9221, partial [Athelia sp. TMB]